MVVMKKYGAVMWLCMLTAPMVFAGHAVNKSSESKAAYDNAMAPVYAQQEARADALKTKKTPKSDAKRPEKKEQAGNKAVPKH